MNKGKITLKNYRNIPYNNSISFEVKEGITFILGVNNIGKSNLIKVFHELNGIFSNHNSQFTAGKESGYLSIKGATYSQLLNQKSPTQIITIISESNDIIYNLNINPINDEALNNNQFIFSFTKEGSSTNAFDKEEFGIIEKIFSNSLYVGSFRTPNSRSSGDYFDIKIGTDFIKTWDSWANGVDIIKRNRISELRDELKELFGFDRFEISVNTSKTNLIITTENGSFLLDELGGGIGHFILVLGNALMQEPDFILIDEPENALHPKLQQTFITTLASKAKVGLIATSHSIGLARSTADYIYSLTKDNSTGRIKLSKFGENYSPSIISAINELGYSQFVELGGNNILLVEGRTDIKSFKEILKKYGIEQHFILMDLGGSNMINGESYEELNELKRLNAKSYSVIVDSEISAEDAELDSKITDFKDICVSLGFNTFLTEVHSTDNYTTQEAINMVIGSNYPVLGKYENLESQERKSNNTKWGKSLNWRIFRKMNKSDFAGTELENFILNTLKPLTE